MAGRNGFRRKNMYTSTVALWRAGAAVLSYTQNKISSHLAPGKNVGFTYDGRRWRPQIFDIRYLFISLLSDLCCSAELPEVEIISLIEEKIPRYKLRADSAISFTGNIILLFTFSLVFFFLSFLYNSSFFFYSTTRTSPWSGLPLCQCRLVVNNPACPD